MNKILGLIVLIFVFQESDAQYLQNVEIGAFRLEIPMELFQLTKLQREQRYAIQGHAPDEVYQTENDDINISYMSTFVPIQENKFPILKSNLERQFTNPNSSVLKSEIIELSGKKYILNQVMLKTSDVFMTNLVTEKEGKMIMLIISHSTNSIEYLRENEQIVNSLKLL